MRTLSEAPELAPLRLPELTDRLDALRHAIDAARLAP
jgi:hypothetical protein